MLLFFHLPPLTKTLLISLIAILTLIGIMLRPFKWNEAMIAMAGAGILLIVGLINPLDALTVLLNDWNIFLFFLGMMALSALAEAAGLFDWLAAQAARLAGGSSRRLLLNIFLLGSVISMVLSNDATALILTPIVYTLVTRLRLPVLPFLFACTFIADTASFLLPVSNPINIIVLTTFHLDLWTFLRLLFLPGLLVICINIVVFFFLYRQQLKGSLDILEEGGRYFPGAELIRKEGRPEREIVNSATEWAADLVVICPRSPQSAGPPLGPKSVGHVARFVLDHAPCPVLLVRPIAREVFPIPR
jgi:arsenical pump membrane protein